MAMYMGKVGQAGRMCVRCHRELTDAASMEVGIGPICRKLDNSLLAAQIPANVPQARLAISTVPVEKLDPQTVNVFATVDAALNTTDALFRQDWRTEVKRLEWLLSFDASRQSALVALTGVVRSLGYVGLASLWEGTASTGVAKVRCADGRLYVAGPRNADFRMAVKKVTGWKFHYAKDNERPEWSVPVTAYEDFNTMLMTYYPVSDGRTEAIEAAKVAVAALLATAPAAPVPANVIVTAPVSASVGATVSVKGKVRIEAGPEWVKVFTPYNAHFISELKTTISYGSRKWEPVAKCWEVRASETAALQSLLQKHFNAGEVVTPAPALGPVTIQTPKNVMPF